MTKENVEPMIAPEVEERQEIFLPPPPPCLTRFYGDIEFAMDVFHTKSIALIRVSRMNDPFDPYFEFITNFEERYASILTWIEKSHGIKEVRWFKDRMPYNSWAKFLRDIKIKNSDLKENSYLFCASAPSENLDPSQNLYMWGHYCAGHRGVAIEFDAERVAASVHEHQTAIHPEWSKEQRVWTPVLYRDEIDRLTAGDFYELLKSPAERELQTRFAVLLNTVSRLKSKVWQVEQEWRLMWRNDEVERIVYKIPILAGSVRRVFVGLRVTEELTMQLAAECRKAFPEAEILRAAQRPGEFALDFQPVR